MFRCNNQTQFNQKTQNCDWWYNVNCGGRLGSPADFEQATDGPSAEPTTQRQPVERKAAERGEQDSNLAEASSDQPQQSQTGNGLEEMQLLMKAAPEEQEQSRLAGSASDKSAAEQHNSLANHNDWSSTNQDSNQLSNQADQQQQQQQQAAVELFHHSDSLTNITIAPELASPQPQQSAPRASTPIFVQSPTTNANSFFDRSTTTQDPLLVGGVAVREGTSSTEASESAPSSSAAPAVQGGASSSTSTSTISADSTSSQQLAASTEPASEPAAASVATAEQTTARAAPDAAPESDALKAAGRRLVQSEFGLGVKQGSKAARSTSGRFQFVRAHQPDQLFSGAVVEEKQQASNHKYQQQQETPLYSTSANQGSVSYSPQDEQLRPAISEADARGAAGSNGGVAARKPERRFGARLIATNSNNQQQTDLKEAQDRKKKLAVR